MKITKKAVAITTFWAIAAMMLAAPAAQAVSYWDPSDTIGYESTDLQDTVVGIVQWALGLLALVAVIMIIIGGFMWMTAGGNDEKIEKAKKLISAAVIGLIIVLLAWAIVIFVIGVTNNATGT